MAPSHTLFAAVALSSSFPQHHCASVTDRFSATGYRSNGQAHTLASNQGKESRSNAQRKFHRVQASPTAFTQSFLPPHPTAQTVDIRLDTSYASMISRPTTPILNQSGSGSLATPRSSTEQLRSSRQSITIEEPERPRTAASHSSLHSGTGMCTSSPARSGVVGDGMYGGRRGGPSLNKSQTSSSGGLSDVKAGYERRVGFDTMPDADETNSGAFSFTLQVKSRGFLRTKNTRTFMVAVDDNPYSERALEWLMENLVEDGDEVVAVRILDEEADQIDQEDAREEARELMASIVELNEEAEDRKISIVVEFVAGKVVLTILNIIHVYRPDSLTVGTRGKSANKFQKMLGQHIMGHVSRDILTSSPVPVVVVRPEAKVQKHLKKRLNDPNRRGYHNLVKGVEGLPMSITKNKRRSLQVPS